MSDEFGSVDSDTADPSEKYPTLTCPHCGSTGETEPYEPYPRAFSSAGTITVNGAEQRLLDCEQCRKQFAVPTEPDERVPCRQHHEYQPRCDYCHGHMRGMGQGEDIEFDPERSPDSLIELRMLLVDHNDCDEEDQPRTYHSRQAFTNYELSKTGAQEFASATAERAAYNLFRAFREDGGEHE